MFTKYILESEDKSNIPDPKTPQKPQKTTSGAPETPETILRRNGVKISLVTPTSFGTQIDLAKNYNPEKIKGYLVGYDIKIKGKSIFVVS